MSFTSNGPASYQHFALFKNTLPMLSNCPQNLFKLMHPTNHLLPMSLDGAGAHFELQLFDYFPDKYATGMRLLLLIPSDQCVRLSNSPLTCTRHNFLAIDS